MTIIYPCHVSRLMFIDLIKPVAMNILYRFLLFVKLMHFNLSNVLSIPSSMCLFVYLYLQHKLFDSRIAIYFSIASLYNAAPTCYAQCFLLFLGSMNYKQHYFAGLKCLFVIARR